MGSNTRCAKLRDDKCSVRNDLLQAVCPNLPHDLIGPKRPLPGGAPHVDTPCIEHEYPCVNSSQLGSEPIKAHLVVGRNEKGRFGSRLANGIQSRINPMPHPANPPTDPPCSKMIRQAELSSYLRNDAYWRIERPHDPRFARAWWRLDDLRLLGPHSTATTRLLGRLVALSDQLVCLRQRIVRV